MHDTNENRNGVGTPWGTYLSVENVDGDGSIYEVDPKGEIKATRTLLGSEAGRSAWTSVAIDNRRSNSPVFYVSSNQDDEGFVIRYKPSQEAINAYLFSDPAFNLLQEDAAPTVEYLVLVPTPDDPSRGVFTWIDDEDLGRDSAANYFAAVSSLDVYDGGLYMTSEDRQELFILDIDNEEYTSESTDVGDFGGDPASVVHILSGHESRRRRQREGSFMQGIVMQESQACRPTCLLSTFVRMGMTMKAVASTPGLTMGGMLQYWRTTTTEVILALLPSVQA